MPKTTSPNPAAATMANLSRVPHRVLLKLSGEAFCKPGGFGIDSESLDTIANEVCEAREAGAQVAIVVGGGNIIRGAALARQGHIPQASADYMGMLGTVINGVALKERLETLGVQARLLSAIEIRAVAEPFIRGRAIRHLEKGRVVIMAAGTGNPFFTTDTCAALRASELECELLLKATKVDGVYTADPKTNPTATKYERLSYAEAIDNRLRFMDLTALAMCEERGIPVLVFDFWTAGNTRRVVEGDSSIGTRLG
ncbi:MAG: UMP kinase [Phycisphaerales bacterium]